MHAFPFGRNESEQNEEDGAARSETREIQVVCFAYIFQSLDALRIVCCQAWSLENVFCTL